MTDVLDGVRDHYRATGLTERLRAALAPLGPEDRRLGFRTLIARDDTEAAKAWAAQLRASGPPPAPNLGVVMGPEFAELAANLGRNLMQGRLGILTGVFEAASRNA